MLKFMWVCREGFLNSVIIDLFVSMLVQVVGDCLI